AVVGPRVDAGPSGRVAAALAALAIGIFTWPALPKLGTALLGHPFGEVDNHLWMATFGGRAAPTRNLPVGFDLPLMDPVHLLVWVPAGLVGPVFAYNAAALVDLALAALGGWVLARELGATRAGALVGMTVTAFSPFLAGMIEFGITEAWPIGWLALHAALLLRFGRTGAVRDALGAGAALGALLLSGWYHAAFALVAEVGLGVWAVARGPRLRTVLGVLAQGALATLPVLPRLEETQAKAAIWAPRLSGLTKARVYEDWARDPRFGTDLLNLVTPRVEALDASRTVYVGLVALGLALVGATRRRGLAALAIAAALWVLTLGHWLRVAGEPVPGLGPLPAGWLAGTFEAARGLSHWYRAAGPATVFLAAAAALGASRLLGAGRGAAVGAVALAGAVFVDAVALSPVPWPRVTYTPDPPPALLALPEPGGLLQLPFDEGKGLPDIASRRVYDQWQVFHGRPVTEHYEGKDALLYDDALVAEWQLACAGLAPRPPWTRTPAEAVARLRDLGVDYVVVHPAHAKPGCVAAVERRLGEPVVRDGRAVVWALGAAAAGR
ncbi:MAG: hypothetical protein ACK4YP_16655, partial [Myxococcota bacterium]